MTALIWICTVLYAIALGFWTMLFVGSKRKASASRLDAQQRAEAAKLDRGGDDVEKADMRDIVLQQSRLMEKLVVGLTSQQGTSEIEKQKMTQISDSRLSRAAEDLSAVSHRKEI